MPDDQKILADLKKCMRDCNGDPDGMAACQEAFENAGGTVTAEGGKVFKTSDGGEAFVTTGGKVFETSGGSEAPATRGGKVF